MAAVRGQSDSYGIPHRSNWHERSKMVKDLLNQSVRYFEKFAEIGREMVKKPMDHEDKLARYFDVIFPDPTDAKTNTRNASIKNRLVELWENGAGNDNPEVKGSLWAAYNAVTEWVDHERGTRGNDDLVRSNNRAKSLMFGSGATIKEKAFHTAVELLY